MIVRLSQVIIKQTTLIVWNCLKKLLLLHKIIKLYGDWH